MTLQQALSTALSQGLARIDAQILLLHVLGRAGHDRAWLITHDTDALPPALQAQFEALCQRRRAGVPVAYLTGRKAFYGLKLQVDERVLDPRPDTETLVDWALEVLAHQPAPRVVDLGTGSGAIALALQQQRPDAQVLAVDASTDALIVAQANATHLGLPVHFHHGHWLQGLAGGFDAIVSNPPYIAAADPHLAALTHEPLAALASGADGLDDLRSIIAQAPAHLAPGGWLLLEHGHDQADTVGALLHAAGLEQVQNRKDLAGIVRCSGGQKPTVK
ncbi:MULTISPECIES: peptide chain release factor N(5)-glutamine methyltransferase [unclassified Simplicispira]|uniref:peptide chain release factor N(5)-glutamine methyltransferase n=1 Tax=unclassified Simplicispira TaxID=2630407 RepID=UPI000D5E122D|nr:MULTISPECIES: peptide chain release factor N(5)-glutamine methyltransferase [unclassified Simplicispira]PVY54855.1 [protein release factor]-glutamine N5-methyltransferase [Simplicispira sp. 125]REG15797.1 [protein release factor]-glutamine N5-methyltransferase [Simplicispira sp. 110]